MLARQREKLNELGSWMLPNGRTAQMQPFLALLCVRVRLRGIVLLGPVQEKQLISDTICGNQLKPKKRTEADLFSVFGDFIDEEGRYSCGFKATSCESFSASWF